MPHLVVLASRRLPYFAHDPQPSRRSARIDWSALLAPQRMTAAEKRDAAIRAAALFAHAPQQPAYRGPVRYQYAFQRHTGICTTCGGALDAGSYLPRIYRDGETTHADLCLDCARTYGTSELRAYAAAALRRKRAG